MSTNPGSFLARSDFKERLASLLGAFTCGLMGILLGLSIGASLFRWNFINSGPGDLFTGAYGMFALIIPLYLFWAAWILCDASFKPGRIFLLSTVIIPFLTLALGFSFIRDFETRRAEFALLDTLGISGFSLMIITAAILETVGILVIYSLFFSKSAEKKTPPLKAADVSGTIIQNSTPVTESVPAKPAAENPAELPVWEPLKSVSAYSELNPDCAVNPSEDKVLVLNASIFNPYAQVSRPEEAFLETGELLAVSLEEAEVAEEWEQKEAEQERFELEEESEQAVEFEEAEAAEFEETEALDEGLPIEETDETWLEIDPFADETAFAAEEPTLEEESAEIEQIVEVKKNPKKHTFSKGGYSVPVEGILTQYPDGQYWIIDEETKRAGRILQETLSEFGILAEVTGIRKGPVITMFEILPAPGVKLSKIVNLQDNIALRLAASSVRIVAPIPGKHAVGIEVPNKKRNIVSFREIIEGELNRRENRKNELPMVLGKDITGDAVTVDLTQMPHLLIAGSTGSGKSVCVNSMILSILYQLSPAECRLIMIDPKIVELKLYNDIPHLLTPVITEPKRAFQALQYCIFEMERRYACLDSMGVRDIRSYNKRIRERNIAAEHMPYIVVIIDEFADLMATTGKELESTVARLAAMSRAVGIHLVLATQRPSIDVITGLIKANIPSRIAFMVASKMDSRIIIDMVGAEKLLGKGDMLYAGAVDPFPIRMQGAFISEEEVERVVDYVKSLGEPEYIDDEMFYDEEEEDTGASLFSDGDDPLYEKALEVVMQQGKASASYIQRRLKIGYNRAARLVENMEHRGVVGPAQGSRPRELLRSA